jgi:hypothetical protein
MCGCGDHGVVDSQPASARALEAHLHATGHRRGEYFYGCPDQRTTVEVSRLGPGRVIHQLV